MKFKSLLIALSAMAMALPAAAAKPARPVDTAADSAGRAVAAIIGPLINKNVNTIQNLGIEINRDTFVKALNTYLAGGNIGFDERSGDAYIEARVRALHPRPADTVSVASQKQFLDKMAKTDGAVILPGGTIFIVVTEGEGPMPGPNDTVTAKYTGRFADGQIFDSTEGEGPIDLQVAGVVPGLSEALKQTRPGGTYRVIIPADKAYGPHGIEGAIPGNAALDFTIQIVGVKPSATK